MSVYLIFLRKKDKGERANNFKRQESGKLIPISWKSALGTVHEIE